MNVLSYFLTCKVVNYVYRIFGGLTMLPEVSQGQKITLKQKQSWLSNYNVAKANGGTVGFR